MAHATIVLPTTHPFRLDLTAWALRRRGKNEVDRWDDGQYTRLMVVEGHPMKVTVVQETTSRKPELVVTVESATRIGWRAKTEVAQLVEKMFGLAIDLRPFYKLARGNAVLGPLVERFAGVRPPRFPTVFEGLLNAIACQQVTLDLGIALLNRLSQRFGAQLDDHGTTLHAFPTPADLAAVPEEPIRQLGFSGQKARAIQQVASDVAAGRADLSAVEHMTNPQAVAYLSGMRGIGRWSAEYVLLRGLGRLDTFPGDDIGAQNNLRRLFQLSGKPNYDQIRQLTAAWHPYEGMVYFHLLLDKLGAKGLL